MGLMALAKRLFPFLGALALGLFVASFFVGLAPGFRKGHREGGNHRGVYIEEGRRCDERKKVRKSIERLENAVPPPPMIASPEEGFRKGPLNAEERRFFENVDKELKR